MELPIKEIQTEKIKNRKCYVYIMHEYRPKGLPSKRYINVCKEGYLYFGFDTTVLKRAIEKSTAIELVMAEGKRIKGIAIPVSTP